MKCVKRVSGVLVLGMVALSVPLHADDYSGAQYCDHTVQFNCSKACENGDGGIAIGPVEITGAYSWKVTANDAFFKLCKPSGIPTHKCCTWDIVCGEAKYYAGHGCLPRLLVFTEPFITNTCYMTGSATWKVPCPQVTAPPGPLLPPGPEPPSAPIVEQG